MRLCKEFEININLPGNTDFDPKKPDATDLVEDFFPQKIGAKCGLPNAFFEFKRNERECLELNLELKKEVALKREKDSEKVKLLAIVCTDGVESLDFNILKKCLDYDVINKWQYEAEIIRREKAYLKLKELNESQKNKMNITRTST